MQTDLLVFLSLLPLVGCSGSRICAAVPRYYRDRPPVVVETSEAVSACPPVAKKSPAQADQEHAKPVAGRSIAERQDEVRAVSVRPAAETPQSGVGPDGEDMLRNARALLEAGFISKEEFIRLTRPSDSR